ncbi:uncharacterized protein LOC129913551 [Episyrphus balteatus]|uniref:uncharacterized protein LOC129913551 n=1 Tax=Episyrphus balteatus TaxID=286459 RepID=UPI002485FA7C|nr:uncharacterized protein LOC129913551 [Episyrphus balteatus]
MIWNMFRIFLLLTLAIGIESANPIRNLNSNGTLGALSKTNKSSAEINNLLLNATSELETIQFRKIHIDEENDSSKYGDSNDDEKTVDLNDLKYDVEILQPGKLENLENEDLEIEERFKGPSINFNTNEFYDENIEVNSQTMQQTHVILTITLIVLAIVSIGIYAGLVMWRSSLEKRYGMRQRLMTDDDFCTNVHDSRPY